MRRRSGKTKKTKSISYLLSRIAVPKLNEGIDRVRDEVLIEALNKEQNRIEFKIKGDKEKLP